MTRLKRWSTIANNHEGKVLLTLVVAVFFLGISAL